MALFTAATLAWVSWKFIEKPSISFARSISVK
jgi:peptidoglycan/LPS O-acetylase OafA/YrhL